MERLALSASIWRSVFQPHGAPADGGVVFRKSSPERSSRFLSEQPPCTVAVEACGSAHHWARAMATERTWCSIDPTALLKPFVKRQRTMRPTGSDR